MESTCPRKIKCEKGGLSSKTFQGMAHLGLGLPRIAPDCPGLPRIAPDCPGLPGLPRFFLTVPAALVCRSRYGNHMMQFMVGIGAGKLFLISKQHQVAPTMELSLFPGVVMWNFWSREHDAIHIGRQRFSPKLSAI